MNNELIKHPIRVPANPFWDVFKRFGRDEMIAMVMNVVGTAIISGILGGHKEVWFYAMAIALAGPVVEKAGFFPAHIKDALDVYNGTPPEKRKPFLHYFIGALKTGSVSLLEDILVHDPLYVVFMITGVRLYPATPPWLLATGSFIIALFCVAGGEVAINEIRYFLKRLWLSSIGFKKEKYYECRFFISSEKKPVEVLQRMSEEYGLTIKEEGSYEDHYYETKLPGYSGRTVSFRMRYRTVGGENVNTIQIVYRRIAEIAKSQVSQFRFFPQEKHKYYLILDSKRDFSMVNFKNGLSLEALAKKFLVVGKMYIKNTKKVIKFKRTIARNYPDGLFVSIDDVGIKRPFFLVELKVYKDLRLMKRAMRFIMTEFPVIQTTYSKDDLING